MQKTVKTGFRDERKRILTPSLSQGEGECSDGKDEGNVVKISSFSHTQLLLTIFERKTVASHLFGKPPKHRRGTSWKRRQTSP